jgi:hypothetical protein
LSNVVRQLCSHTVVVVEQVSRPAARAQFFLQASANVSVAPPVPGDPPSELAEPPVAEAPPVTEAPATEAVPPVLPEAPPVAEVPAAAVLPPGFDEVPPVAGAPSLLLQPQTPETTLTAKTSDPSLLFNMSCLLASN